MQTKYQFLIQQYKNNIYSYSLYMLKNHTDAEDVTQEVFIKIWENLGRFNILAAKAWIFRSTHNLCIDYLRRRNLNYKYEYSIDENYEELLVDDKIESNPHAKTHIKMMTSKVKEAIERLPDKLKSVFVLYEIQGLKYREIGKALEMPINTVKVYLLRARQKLQEELKDYGTQEVL